MNERPAPGRLPTIRSETLDLEDLLGEIRRRAAGASVAQSRLTQLLDAVVAVSSNLDLTDVLTRIVDSACSLVGARYGALGVLDETGSTHTEFLSFGVESDLRARLGDLPHGTGVIGLVMSEGRTVCVGDIAAHPAHDRFPEGHPPMTSFLGTPVRVRDKVFGNLYLCDRSDGRPFDDDDVALIEGLAAAAGIAIENAQLYRHAKGREEWAHVVGQLTRTLLEGRNEDAALTRMIRHARELGDAELGLLAVRADDGTIAVRALESRTGAGVAEGVRLDHTRWDLVLRGRVPLLLMSRPDDRQVGDLAAELTALAGLDRPGAAAIVPITVGSVEVGLMCLVWGEDERGVAAETMQLLTSFAEQMGLVIEAGRAQRQRARTRLLEDRDRIARDMHDHVIQRLYGAGLSLQTAARQSDEAVRDRIDAVTDELDLAIKDIREAIFDLHQHLPEGGLGPEIEALVARAGESAGFVPDLTFEGTLADIPPEFEQDVIAVVREGLSNVVRHAGASDARVLVSTHDDLVVTVTDDGVGIGDGEGRSGLVNLESRALAHGGTFSVTARLPAGTMLRWRVPLPV